MIYLEDSDFTLHQGDVREILPTLPEASVDCALTSPPFYGLRDYGVEGQIGLEASPEEWCEELVGVFREVRRVLRPAGTLWVECGDSYNAYNGNRGPSQSLSARADDGRPASPPGRAVAGLKEKDLLGQPWLLAFALRADGWFLRQCIVWAKPDAMPESVRDRCTTAHSYLFLLSRQARYWFDADAIAEETAGDYSPRSTNGVKPRTDERRGFDTRINEPMKNARSVWTIPTSGFPEAHFATWPEALVERILRAGCPEWVCGTCGKARERLSEAEEPPEAYTPGETPAFQTRRFASATGGYTRPRETVGWSDCGHDDYRPGTCLDPFMGSGTTALVARRLGRRAVGVELSGEYCAMAARRTRQLSLLA